MPEEPYLFKRTCTFCGFVWWGNHCPHDNAQNPCPGCDRHPVPEPDTHFPEGFCDCDFDPFEDDDSPSERP